MIRTTPGIPKTDKISRQNERRKKRLEERRKEKQNYRKELTHKSKTKNNIIIRSKSVSIQPENNYKPIINALKNFKKKIHQNWLLNEIKNLGIKIPNEEEIKSFIQKDQKIENILMDVLKTAIEKSGSNRELIISVYPDTDTDLYLCIRQDNYQDSTLIKQLYNLIDELRKYTSKKEVEADLDVSILIDTDYIAPERISSEQPENSTV